MTDSSPANAAQQYVAEYADGPLEGTTEHRYQVDGEPEARVTQVALVDGTEALFEYVAGETRSVGDVHHVTFTLDAADSDSLQGQADPDEESKHL